MLSRTLAVLFLCFMSLAAGAARKKPPAQPVNINTASAVQLHSVPGIGPSTAGNILQMRKSYGAFKSVNDLLAIRGLGQARLDKMRKYLTVNKPGASSAAHTAGCTGCAKQKPFSAAKSTTTFKGSTTSGVPHSTAPQPQPDATPEMEEPR
jgi:competence ComEA-like helix-hairpin-helix protein